MTFGDNQTTPKLLGVSLPKEGSRPQLLKPLISSYTTVGSYSVVFVFLIEAYLKKT